MKGRASPATLTRLRHVEDRVASLERTVAADRARAAAMRAGVTDVSAPMLRTDGGRLADQTDALARITYLEDQLGQMRDDAHLAIRQSRAATAELRRISESGLVAWLRWRWRRLWRRSESDF